MFDKQATDCVLMWELAPTQFTGPWSLTLATTLGRYEMNILQEVYCLLTTVREGDHEQLAWHLTSLKKDVGPVRFILFCTMALLLWRLELHLSV